jgi:hypothetical protein
MPTRPQKITFGELRASGVRGILIYFSDYRCSHHVAMIADRWPDDVRLSDIEPRFVCAACGKRGADVRPDFAPARMGTGTGRTGLTGQDDCPIGARSRTLTAQRCSGWREDGNW